MAVVNKLNTDQNQVPPPSASEQPVPPPPAQQSEPAQQKPRSKKAYIIGFFVTLLLIGGVGVGVFLIQNQQIFKSKASGDVVWCASFNCPNGDTDGNGECRSGDDGLVFLGYGDGKNCLPPDCGQTDYYCGGSQGDWDEYCGHDFSGDFPNCGGGGGPAPSPTPTLAICGDSCQQDSDCAQSTHPGVGAVVCREGECVSQECYDTGGETVPGTLCLCQAAGQCGAECGADVGLCDIGFSCTYRAQIQCNPSLRGVCVPTGTEAAGRGPMEGVPLYDDAAFERRQCGGNVDANNNYIYHSSFPNHVFTTEEVLSLICNPAPSASPTASPAPTPTGTPGTEINAQCLVINVYDLNWNQLTNTQLAQLQPGDQVRFGVLGYASDNGISQARFTINGSQQAPTSQKRTNTEEYYMEYTIPEPATGETQITISVQAELYHAGLGQWF